MLREKKNKLTSNIKLGLWSTNARDIQILLIKI